MLGIDIVVLSLSACCAWLPDLMLAPRTQGLNDSAMEPMKGRAVAIELGAEFTEAGMRDPAGEIATPLADAIAKRYGMKFEPGRAAGPDTVVLAVQTREWTLAAGFTDYRLRYRGEATITDRQSGRRLGRAWCDGRSLTGWASPEAALADRPALAKALHVAADSCLQQFRKSLIAEATPR